MESLTVWVYQLKTLELLLGFLCVCLSLMESIKKQFVYGGLVIIEALDHNGIFEES